MKTKISKRLEEFLRLQGLRVIATSGFAPAFIKVLELYVTAKEQGDTAGVLKLADTVRIGLDVWSKIQKPDEDNYQIIGIECLAEESLQDKSAKGKR